MSPFDSTDLHWMRLAMAEAVAAEAAGEVPVGAVLVQAGELLATAGNRPIAQSDPSAHAEMLVLRAAAARMRNYRLPGSTLYVTLEPCVMCAGAIVLARVERVVFAATDPRAGAAGSVFDVLNVNRLNHAVVLHGGCLADESARLLRDFFRARRGRRVAPGLEVDGEAATGAATAAVPRAVSAVGPEQGEGA
ncbi:MAG TPA: tRNA adenosine(34) deaminase TadA [Gammaproteobacteria bacterium]|nr:tRNA adenosine(34) deaminase TadA [Gammaproteobacteria bacterium]